MEDPLGLGYGLGALSFAASVAFSLAEGALSDFSWSKVEEIAEERKVAEKTARFLQREDDIALAASGLKVAANILFVFMAVHLCLVNEATMMATYLVALASMAGIILVADVPAFLVGRRLAEPLLVRMFPALDVLRFLLQPALWASRFGGEIIARVLGHPDTETQAESIAEDILSAAAEGRHGGVFDEEEEEMIEGIVRFKEREISDVMTPRTDLALLPAGTSSFEAAKFALEKGFSRIPLFRDTPDTIVGVLHVRDLLPFLDPACQDPPPVDQLARKPFFAPETKKVAELFQELRANKVHMAVVLDEYGGTAGLVTLEDILEEIVGEIEDEYDSESSDSFEQADERTAVVDGRLRIDDLNDLFLVDIPERDGYDTVGGFLCAAFGHVPKRGESFREGPVEFTVMDSDARKVRRVQVLKVQEP